MDFDISHLLEQWDYQPGQVVVRRFKGKDGKEKIQLRVDLGLLQMNAETRGGIEPMGKIFLLTFLFIGLPDSRQHTQCFCDRKNV